MAFLPELPQFRSRPYISIKTMASRDGWIRKIPSWTLNGRFHRGGDISPGWCKQVLVWSTFEGILRSGSTQNQAEFENTLCFVEFRSFCQPLPFPKICHSQFGFRLMRRCKSHLLKQFRNFWLPQTRQTPDNRIPEIFSRISFQFPIKNMVLDFFFFFPLFT